MKFGKRIRRWRALRGLTQAQLARLCDVSVQTISQWELDDTCPTLANLGKVCAALRIGLAELEGPMPAARQAKAAD